MAPINLLAERNHTCKYCGRLFKFKWNLTEHERRRHENKRPHKCNLCPKSFVNKSDLKNHATSHNERLFKCKYCEKAFKSTRNRSWHEDTHGFNQYQCSICKQTFKKVQNLYSHKKDHRNGNNGSSYDCPYCIFTFSTLEFKNEHVSKAHKKHTVSKVYKKLTDGEVVHEEKQKNSRLTKIMQESESCPMPPYSCISCAQTFENANYLLKHIKAAHPGENIFHQICQVCGKKISLNYFRHHMMSHYNIKPFACNVCDSRFSRQHELNYHLNVHSTLRIFNCSECPSKFKSKLGLNKHKKDIHSSDIYTCNICSRLFKTNHCLKRHIKRVHNKSENSKKCSVCNVEIFYRNFSLHMNQFHDEIESLCEICGKTCKNAWYLKKHLKKCKKVLIKPPGRMRHCPHCSSKHQNIMILKKHCLKNHGDKIRKCQSCDHISICKVSYDRHQNKHKNIPKCLSGNENSECYFCGFIAIGAESLAVHLKTHEYSECYFCGFIATGSHILTEHLKSHEYYKWLLSWNKVDSCCEESIYVANANCHYLSSKEHTSGDNKYSLLIKSKKEISWIHYISDTKTKVYHERRSTKIHQAEENEKKIKETKDNKPLSKIYQAGENEIKVNYKPVSKINQPRSYFVANPCLRSKDNLDCRSTIVDSMKLEVIDLDIDENSSPSLFCDEKLEVDESQDDVEKNHSSVNAINSTNINAVTQFNVTDTVPLKPFIYIEDLKKLDECSLKDLLKYF